MKKRAKKTGWRLRLARLHWPRWLAPYRRRIYLGLGLAAVVTLEGAKAFVAQYGLNDALIYRVTRAGREWAVVVSGDYANMKSAQLAAQSLPLALTKSKPWARRFAVLQKELVDQPTPIN